MARVKLIATLTYTVDEEDYTSLKEEKEMFSEQVESYSVGNKKVKVEKAK